MKKEIRILGIDDAPHKFKSRGQVLVVGTVFRGGYELDGLLSTKAEIDGSDSTEKIISMVNGSKFKPQLKCIFLDGIAVGGFNVIDIRELNKKTKIPVMAIMRKMPDITKMKEALDKSNNSEKIRLLEKAGEIVNIGSLYVQFAGIKKDEAKELLKISCTRSNIPEPLRISHLIASGIVDGESLGKA